MKPHGPPLIISQPWSCSPHGQGGLLQCFWREKAQHLALSLAQSKASVSSLQEAALLLQASVLERDSEQQRLQVSHVVAGKTPGPSAPQGVSKSEVTDTSTQWNPS